MEDLFNAGYKKQQVLDALRQLPVVSYNCAGIAGSRTGKPRGIASANLGISVECDPLTYSTLR